MVIFHSYVSLPEGILPNILGSMIQSNRGIPFLTNQDFQWNDRVFEHCSRRVIQLEILVLAGAGPTDRFDG